MMKYPSIGLSFIMLLTLTHTPLRSETDSKIPFEFINNQIIVNTYVRATGPFRFILDTGSSLSALDTRIARRLGLPIFRRTFKADTVGKNKEIIIKRTFIPHLKVGSSYAWQLWAYSVNLSKLSRKIGTKIHGIIGFNFLENRIIRINYPEKYLQIYPDDIKSVNQLLDSFIQRTSTVIIPFTFIDNHTIPVIDGIKVNDQSIRASIDTGSSLSMVLFPSGIRKTGLSVEDANWSQKHIIGLAGEAPVYVGKVPTMEIGPFVLNSPEIILASSWHERAHMEKRDASIGNDLLKYFDVIFDYPRQRLILAYTPKMEVYAYPDSESSEP